MQATANALRPSVDFRQMQEFFSRRAELPTTRLLVDFEMRAPYRLIVTDLDDPTRLMVEKQLPPDWQALYDSIRKLHEAEVRFLAKNIFGPEAAETMFPETLKGREGGE